MEDAFEYQLVSTFEVGTVVLFGDIKDVKLENLKEPDVIKSEGGTILFTQRKRTSCFPGSWCLSKIKFDDGWFHLIHKQDCSGKKLGHHLLQCDLSDFHDPNVWSRYDWCHWRNWECRESTEDSEENEFDSEENESDSEENESDEEEEEEKKTDEEKCNSIFFVSVSGDTVVSTIELDDSCIQGDWNYGFRVTDPDSGLAFAYGFGDYLVNRILRGDGGKPTDKLQVGKSLFTDDDHKVVEKMQKISV